MMKKSRCVVLCVCISIILSCIGCSNVTFDDYYKQMQQTETQFVNYSETVRIPYEKVKCPDDVVLIEDYDIYGNMHLTANGSIQAKVTGSKICKDINEYNSIFDNNPEFIRWLEKSNTTSEVKYDANSNTFTSPIEGIEMNIFLISMEFYNPTDKEQAIGFSTLRLHEYDKSSNSFKSLNIIGRYCYDRATRTDSASGRYSIGAGEKYSTTLCCIIPKKRILAYDKTVNEEGSKLQVKEVEEYNLESIYLRLSTYGTVRINDGENFIKIKSDYTE